MVTESNCELRDDTDKMLGMMHQADIPVLVMSAGVGDLIQEILKHFNLIFSNLTVGRLYKQMCLMFKSMILQKKNCSVEFPPV